MGQTCSKGHEVRDGVAFCTTCGEELPTASPPEAIEPAAPTSQSRGRRRAWVALGALLVIVVAGAGLAWAVGGDDPSTQEDEFIAAVRRAAPDSTATLTDANILDTGQINCEMARTGTLPAEIEQAEKAAALIEVPPGEMTERMSLPLTYLCPQYADALSTTTTQSERATTTAPPSTTTAPPTTAAATPSVESGEAVLRANEAFGVQFGTPGDDAIATISEQVGAPTDRQPINGPGLDGEHIKFPTDISIIIGRAPGDTGPLRLIRWDTTGTWRTDKNIGVGSSAAEVYAAYPNVQETTGCYDDDPPSLTASNPPSEPDPIEFVLDPTGTTVTAMAAPAYNIVGC